MELLTEELRRALPPLYAVEKQENPLVQCCFFVPFSNWTWYVLEFDGEDTFFGLVDGHEVELGCFSLSELESIRLPFGLRVQRDLDFTPTPLQTVREQLQRIAA